MTNDTKTKNFQQVVLVVDFGAQYAQLIARRVREAKVYSEIVSHTITAAEVKKRKPAAIILSGGPKSVHVDGAPKLDAAIYDLGVPIFGICYGVQLIAQQLGGEVARGGKGEYGRATLRRIAGSSSTLLDDSLNEKANEKGSKSSFLSSTSSNKRRKRFLLSSEPIGPLQLQFISSKY